MCVCVCVRAFVCVCDGNGSHMHTFLDVLWPVNSERMYTCPAILIKMMLDVEYNACPFQAMISKNRWQVVIRCVHMLSAIMASFLNVAH